MAHEMGHLFLGIGSHSDRGIMHVPWRTKQLDRAAKGNLLFTPAQAERIRAQVLDRMRAEPLGFTIRVYDYAGASADTLRRAKTAAASVFQYIEIETVWVDCKLPGVAGLADAACTEYQGPTDLVLRLVPHSMAKRYGLRPRVLGVALHGGKAEFGYVAGIFFDRIQGLPGWRSADERPVILGHLIAHEIGHLLLGSGKHSLAGLMRPGWDRKQLKEAVSGTLHFSPWQAKRIRADVLDRMRAEGSSAAVRDAARDAAARRLVTSPTPVQGLP